MSAFPPQRPDGFGRDPGGIDRRSFMQVMTMAAAAVGLGSSAAARMAEAAALGLKPL